MSLRDHRDHLILQKQAEVERLVKKLSEMAPDHKLWATTKSKIAALNLELGLGLEEDEE